MFEQKSHSIIIAYKSFQEIKMKNLWVLEGRGIGQNLQHYSSYTLHRGMHPPPPPRVFFWGGAFIYFLKNNDKASQLSLTSLRMQSRMDVFELLVLHLLPKCWASREVPHHAWFMQTFGIEARVLCMNGTTLDSGAAVSPVTKQL